MLLEAAAVLATFVHSNHRVFLCSRGLTCRLAATPSRLGIGLALLSTDKI
ncbi:Uncharacterised protein [Vibrio cholerae]|nr:Uncharacterised protein [Vibrio cholerae]